MKVVGMGVCGPGESHRYLKQTLEEFKRLTDDCIIATCNATREEINLITSYGFWTYEDNREWGREQPNIKTDLLRRVGLLAPDWILPLDMDETLPTVFRQTLEDLASGREACLFYVVNLWNDEKHYKKSSGFWNVRFFKYLPDQGVQYLRKALHCGLAPPYFYALPAKKTYVPHPMIHYGLMKSDDRLRKSDRYAQYDPQAKYKDRSYYDMLLQDGVGAEYKEKDVLNKLQEFCKNL